jgi:ElaA protein
MSPHPSPLFTWRRLEDFSSTEIHAILAAREDVFVVEQQCPYQDADAYDAVAWHLTGQCGPHLAAYLRLIDPGHKSPEPSIGRVLTTRAFRGTGLGKKVVAEGIRYSHLHFPEITVRLSAQSHLQPFYQSFGFVPASAEYLEDGIPHLEMLLPPPPKTPSPTALQPQPL